MSLITNNASNSTQSTETPPPRQLPTFLETASKVTKSFIAIGLGMIGLGALAVGTTLSPFVPIFGATVIGFSLTCFGISGYLLVHTFGYSAPLDTHRILPIK